MADTPSRTDLRATRRKPSPSVVRPPVADDTFFRHIVSSMRNGVIAFRRDGTLALMNAEAYRIFSLTKHAADIGKPFAEVLHDRPAIVRVLNSTFELSHLPNRAEL